MALNREPFQGNEPMSLQYELYYIYNFKCDKPLETEPPVPMRDNFSCTCNFYLKKHGQIEHGYSSFERQTPAPVGNICLRTDSRP
jgi:hypothetical protein